MNYSILFDLSKQISQFQSLPIANLDREIFDTLINLLKFEQTRDLIIVENLCQNVWNQLYQDYQDRYDSGYFMTFIREQILKFLMTFAVYRFKREQFEETLKICNYISHSFIDQSSLQYYSDAAALKIKVQEKFENDDYCIDFISEYPKEKIGVILLQNCNQHLQSITAPKKSRNQNPNTNNNGNENNNNTNGNNNNKSLIQTNWENVLVSNHGIIGNWNNKLQPLELNFDKSQTTTLFGSLIEQPTTMFGKRFLPKLNKEEQSVTFVITTCKRLRSFIETMNSFIQNCLDLHLIKEWIIIDDQSSEKDIQEMKLLYPFMKLVQKDQNQKGHANSLNIMIEMVTTPYIIYMEDDWKLMAPRHFIRDSIEIATKNELIGQVIFNRYYAECYKDYLTNGGKTQIIDQTKTMFTFHDFINPNTKPAEFYNYVKSVGDCHAHWPHFTLNPSLIKTCIFKKVGNFDSTTNEHVNFEYQFGLKYHEQFGFHSMFLNDILFFNIGKPRNQNSKIKISSKFISNTNVNAYELNK